MLMLACGARTALEEPSAEDASIELDASVAPPMPPRVSCPDFAADLSSQSFDLTLLVDRSGSMGSTLGRGTTVGATIYRGLEEFVTTASFENARLELGFFPQPPAFDSFLGCRIGPRCRGENSRCEGFGLCVGPDGPVADALCRSDRDCFSGTCERVGVCSDAFGNFCPDPGAARGSCVRGVECVQPTACFSVSSCNIADQIPAVRSSPVDDVRTAIVNALRATEFEGDTPIGVAVAAATARVQERRTSLRPLIILVTDGEPTGCNGTRSAVAAVREAALLGIDTYVIGLVAQAPSASGFVSVLDELSEAGGTGSAFRVDLGTNAALDLERALTDIQLDGACRLSFPALESGLRSELSVRMDDESLREGCDSGEGYLVTARQDNGVARRIELCPDTCDRVLRDESLRVSVTRSCAR